MISPNRISRAETEGYLSFQETGGRPDRVEVHYHRHTALWRAFNRGWNRARKEKGISEFQFLKSVK